VLKIRINEKHQNPYTNHFTFKALIETPSFSTEEDKTALYSRIGLIKTKFHLREKYNNVWAFNMYFDKDKPSTFKFHHDTVRPNQAYTNDPFKDSVRKLFGLGVMMRGGCWFPC
jgi:acetylornithine deacetylase